MELHFGFYTSSISYNIMHITQHTHTHTPMTELKLKKKELVYIFNCVHDLHHLKLPFLVSFYML